MKFTTNYLLFYLMGTSLSNLPMASFAHPYQQETPRESNEALRLHAMPPNPNPFQVTYEDGSLSPFLVVRMIGEETSPDHIIYEETLDGFTVRQ